MSGSDTGSYEPDREYEENPDEDLESQLESLGYL